ncbi:VpaChn25_0724 family phage protein [Sphingobium yanoikuyae]|uniref:Uncharacterized protein n=1 Tax=Sphingobium yanoikuyae TaxID=13690 RepID=A0A9X7YEQ4_SPHYA|nr:hypothetical protein [Sphingobium yanoikuyae]QNG47408.1 hypothetical protein H3V42_07300 [Sphingobium yanoikuyae]
MSYEDKTAEDGRLVILKELALQVDGRLNEVSLQRVLETFAITRSRDWVRTQLRKLAELEAIRITEAGTVMIAEIRTLGRNHVERRERIEGVTRPSDHA